MTLQIDSTLVKKLKLIKELALQLGGNVLETPKEETLSSRVVKTKSEEKELSLTQKRFLSELRSSVKFIKDLHAAKNNLDVF